MSPDGRRIVYHARHQSATTLDLRSLDTGASVTLQQTESATYPTFSPDGSQLAFFKAGKLYKLGIDSRVLTALTDVPDGTGISWGVADSIVYSRPGPRGGLFRIAAGGGTPVSIASPDSKAGEQDYLTPEVLPGGSVAVFVVRSASEGNSRFSIVGRSLASAEQKVLVNAAVAPRYVDGYLLYVQGSVLTGIRFDASSLSVTEPAVPLVNGIISKGSTANFGVSHDGTLTYIPGSTINYVSRFIWKGRDGKLLGSAGPSALDYPRYARFSPDGRRFAATLGPAQEGHIWVYDVAGAAQPYKLTFNAHNTSPTWSPDGSRLAFASTRDGPTRNLFTVSADGSVAEPARLVTSDRDKTNLTWSRDGWVVYQVTGETTRADLWKQRADGSGKGEPFLATAFAESNPVFSPDGRWVAFVADTTGADEVWVRPFPGPGAPVRVSSAGGHDPVWSRDGRELFYQEGPKLMAAAVLAREPIRFQTPQMLFEGGFVQWEPNTPRTFDVSADGRFLMVEPSATYSQRFNVVINWAEELKRLVPAP
jgi:dipeptidyl aminopeptidase/acylaminoacyl peptidase